MGDEYSLNSIDSLLFQFALQTRELSQKKNEINQQIKVCRDYITEKKSFIKTLNMNIKKLEEEISVKESIVTLNKSNAKSMKATNSLLLQYEQTLKTEMDSRKASYNQDLELCEERISSCRNTFQSHKEYYYQNPLAQKLLLLQAEKEEIECRIKACDDHITLKQKELDLLTGPAVNSFSTEQLPDSVFGQQPIIEEGTPAACQTEEDSGSFIDISSIHLNQTANGHETTIDANTEEICEENKVQDSPTCSPEKPREELWSFQQYDGQSQPNEIHTEAQDQETSEEDQEEHPIVSYVEDVLETPVQEKEAIDEEQTSEDDYTQRVTFFSQTSSQQANPQSLPEKATTVPSTPTFAFNPGSSPQRDAKSPAFLFSLNSNPSTPGFSGFGFDEGSSQDEDPSFTFTGSFFSEKKAAGKQPSSYSEILFDQPQQSEDFQFAFTAKSPQSANKENSKDEFPFSINF
ncbi:uncharacterized protein LOC121650280 [Melanotaenia boesemani]|uniref:uncharacterized protein LOC121650280 n=1 Tax=Melanotaenia boesemani TaxID=1250792 RepID=UPI001C03D14F|nr:uncharacterized protein LOC121650280 [Melanotaenia boesemani]